MSSNDSGHIFNLNEEQKILLREYWDALFEYFTVTVDYSKCTTEEEKIKEREKVIEGKLHKRSHMNLDNSIGEGGVSDCESPKVSGAPVSPDGLLSPNAESPTSPGLNPNKKLDKRTSFNRFLRRKSNSNIGESNAGNSNSTSNSPPNHYNTPSYKGIAEIKLDNDNILQSMKE